jgi:hypothetical protein
VGQDLLDVAGDGKAAGDLAPRDFDQGVELGVVGPGLPGPLAGRSVRRQPAVVGHVVGASRAGQRVAALADDRGPVQAADDVAEQGTHVVVEAGRGQAELAGLDRRDDRFGLGHGAAVDLAGICRCRHVSSLRH